MPFSILIYGAGQMAAGYDNPSSTEILTHAHALHKNDDFQFLGFYDLNMQKAEEAARKWGVKAYPMPVNADIIVICTPDKFHLESTLQAFYLKPKMIILEKPIARDLTDAKKLIELSNKIPIQVNFTRRFVKEFQDLAYKIKEYGNFIIGNGLYGKGFIHNGSHMIDLLRFLIGDIKEVEFLNEIFDFYPDDPTKTTKISFNNGGEFFMHGFDCIKYTLFELDLCFEKARIKILEGGYKIQYYSTKESDKFTGYVYLNLESEIDTQMDHALLNLYKNTYDYLSTGETIILPVQKAFTQALYE
jgi:hypothetical protein